MTILNELIPFLTLAFMPHGACYFWQPSLVGLHLGSNGIIAISYFSIPFTLIYLVRKRQDLPFNGLFFLFAAFIVFCGLGHLMDIWTLWYPNYWVSGVIRAITAIVSFLTAISLIRLSSRILALPSSTQLEQEIEERKLAETALQESQRRFKAIFNQTFQMMGLLTPEGNILSVNQTALNFMAVAHKEIENLPFWELPGWKQCHAQIKAAIQSVSKSGNWIRLELQWVTDTPTTFDVSFKPLLDEAGNIELMIAEGRDIHQRKQAEAKLYQLNQELEERVKQRTKALEKANKLQQKSLIRERIAKTKIKIYEDIVLSIPIGLTIWHLENLDETDSFRLIDVNPMAMDILQLSREKHIGQRMVDCFPNVWSSSHQRAMEMYAEVVRTQKALRLGDVIYDDQRIGSFHFDVKAFPLPNQCVGIAFEDVTERKKVEKALVISTRRYRQVVNSVNEVIFQLDQAGNWTFLNPAWTKITGYPIIDTLNHSFSEFIIDASQKEVIEHLFQGLITEEVTALHCDFRSCKQEGEFCWLEMKAQRNQDWEENNEISISGTLTDITARKEAEITLTERAKELSHLNTLLFAATAQLEKRNQELDQFAYVTSHDLKAPLRAIANLSEWIEEDITDCLTEETRHHLSLLRQRVQRLENLINGLLEYSRIGRLKLPTESVNVAVFLQEIIDSLAPLDSFTFSIIEEMPTLVTKRLLLQQVFSNLISNAIKHHPRNEGKIEISVQELENYYEFSVKDDGEGIDPAYHQRVFEIFQTLLPRDQKENTGIGLSIVKKIVETQGGTIKLKSNIGEGAIFCFTWPKTVNNDP